ncbi:hypothetical protein LEP1GSC055_0388 [Leptospira borgpetersenii str. Brem 307]|nr:hypothetical protein LEP1GSC055_0388 [Leptospira borgpetersenii str. Brem 307]
MHLFISQARSLLLTFLIGSFETGSKPQQPELNGHFLVLNAPPSVGLKCVPKNRPVVLEQRVPHERIFVSKLKG